MYVCEREGGRLDAGGGTMYVVWLCDGTLMCNDIMPECVYITYCVLCVGSGAL